MSNRKTNWLHLKNGWTLSFADKDTPPAICSIAAWPSSMDYSPRPHLEGNLEEWFTWPNGQKDIRCFCMSDILEAIALVENADDVNE